MSGPKKHAPRLVRNHTAYLSQPQLNLLRLFGLNWDYAAPLNGQPRQVVVRGTSTWQTPTRARAVALSLDSPIDFWLLELKRRGLIPYGEVHGRTS